MSSSKMFFAEAKETTHKQVLDKLLDTYELYDAGKMSYSSVKKNILGIIELLKQDATLNADDKNLLLACAHHVLSLRFFSRKLDEFEKDENHHHQVAAEKLKQVDDPQRMQALLEAHPKANQLKFIFTFGFLCPALIEKYILRNKNGFSHEEIDHIKWIFKFSYNPAYKKILECLRDNCDPAMLYYHLKHPTACLITRERYKGGDIRFLNDILDVLTQCDHQKFVTGFTSDCDAFKGLKCCIQSSLEYVELHIDPRERGGHSEAEREEFYTPWSRDYDAFLQKLLRVSACTPEIFDRESRQKFLLNKYYFQNLVKRLIALKSLPNAEQIEAFIKETRKWTLREWPEENRAYVRSLSVKAASLIAKHINLKKPIPEDAKTFADDHENLEEAISLLLKNDFPDTHKVAARNLLLDLHKVLLKTFVPVTAVVMALSADEKEFKSSPAKRATP